MSKLVTVIVIAADCNDLGEVRSRTYFFVAKNILLFGTMEMSATGKYDQLNFNDAKVLWKLRPRLGLLFYFYRIILICTFSQDF